MLSVEDRGTYAVALLTTLTIGALFGSFTASVGFYITNQKRSAAKVASNSVLLAATVAVLVVVAAAGATFFVDSGDRPMLWLVTLAIVPNIIQRPITGTFVATNQIARHGLSAYGQAYMGMVAIMIWVVVLDHRTARDAIGAWALGEYVSLAAAVGLGRAWWGWFIHHRPSLALMKAVTTFGFVTGMAGVLGFVTGRVSQFLVAGIEGSAGAGIYSTALPLADGLGLFAASIAIASYANIGGLSRRESADLAARSIRHSILIVGVGTIALLVFAPLLVSLLFGARYAEADQSLRILGFGVFLSAPWAFFSTFFVVQLGRPRLVLIFAATGAVLNIGLSSVLIRELGLVGGAWGTTATHAIQTAAGAAVFMHLSNTPLRDLVVIRRDDLMRYVTLARRFVNFREEL